MKNTMKRAHEIRKKAASKWNCAVSEIIFSICLEMAWAETKKGCDLMNEKIEKLTKIWEKYGKKRYYFSGSKRLNKSGAYFTEDSNDITGTVLLNVSGGYICSSKTYNGAVKEEIEEILSA